MVVPGLGTRSVALAASMAVGPITRQSGERLVYYLNHSDLGYWWTGQLNSLRGSNDGSAMSPAVRVHLAVSRSCHYLNKMLVL
jgi:hypothetical protein